MTKIVPGTLFKRKRQTQPTKAYGLDVTIIYSGSDEIFMFVESTFEHYEFGYGSYVHSFLDSEGQKIKIVSQSDINDYIKTSNWLEEIEL